MPVMLMHPQIDPIAIRLGPLAIHWYGLTYLVAFGLLFYLATRRLRHEPYASITQPAPWPRRAHHTASTASSRPEAADR